MVESHAPVVTAGRFDQRPLLVFWETTTACPLACRHCRANAQRQGGPDDLSTTEGIRLIDTLAGIGRPRPILILTGGDCLMREDIIELATYAHHRDVPVAVAPAVSERLTSSMLENLRRAGVTSASLSLDGSNSTHDHLRGVPGHFDATLQAIDRLRAHGFTTQINTVVMASNVHELADVAWLVHEHRVDVWEVFFLVTTGRGTTLPSTSPEENEAVCRFLVDASRYGFNVRTVEAPFFRRLAREAPIEGVSETTDSLYRLLSARLLELLGPSALPSRAPSAATRDGKGIIFVAANGDVYPSGFLPLRLGNVRNDNLIDIYRDDELLRLIRAARFEGPCGCCEYGDLCGGSRSRAYATSGNPLASDPGCVRVTPHDQPLRV